MRGAAALRRVAGVREASGRGLRSWLRRASPWRAGLRFPVAARLAVVVGFVVVAAVAAVVVDVVAAGVATAAAARREPIRSGRVDGSAASTPLSSFFAFAFFFGLSTLSAMAVECTVPDQDAAHARRALGTQMTSAAPSYTL